ncbi:MAG: alpha/beta hydrolase [Paracoccaceae bacterium]|nr:MAG: alpha/beta hydrolase [Paracoccaceae bacterium]
METVAGQSVNLRRLGSGPRTALALHCSLAHGGAFRGLAADLPGITFLAPDLPGHGDSADWDGRDDLHALSTRIALALAHAHGSVDLIGHSFGATVALRAALEAPDLVRTLTLIEPVLFCAARAAGGAEFAAHEAAHADFARHMAAGRREAAAEAFQAIWGAGLEWGDVPAPQRAYIAARIHLIPAQNTALYDDSGGLLDHGRLESLGLPVLLVEGAASPPVMAAIGRELARRLPQARRSVVPGAGHMVPITHPAEVAGLVGSLLPS